MNIYQLHFYNFKLVKKNFQFFEILKSYNSLRIKTFMDLTIASFIFNIFLAFLN